MDKLKAPMVQLALDFPTVDEALKYAELGIRSGIDIIEAGTPLIVSAGASAIGELARAFPGYPVLADYKTMDSGGKNVHLTQQQGRSLHDRLCQCTGRNRPGRHFRGFRNRNQGRD